MAPRRKRSHLETLFYVVIVHNILLTYRQVPAVSLLTLLAHRLAVPSPIEGPLRSTLLTATDVPDAPDEAAPHDEDVMLSTTFWREFCDLYHLSECRYSR
jgi:hypothetical protein